MVTMTPDLDSSVPMSTSHTRSLAIFSEGVFPQTAALVVRGQHALLAYGSELGEVWRLTQSWRPVYLEVIGVEYDALGSVNGGEDAVHNAVLHADKLQLDVLCDLEPLSGIHDMQRIFHSKDLLGLLIS